ncbi:hypothetical protein BU23DRAFT_143746 [Bimuria novae-zelandiae CBS 107.79]|uniref:Uncharacterized protein n=1 Tax=Bimuria novae-zelandiae CBS 107.79 TaxID=1447943 RepID=A0A6A5V954_9PLEO|nr:hypothetical protein BU23DRAFT_143746 [Bimuria novae-zelandiae CBS 107.79]
MADFGHAGDMANTLHKTRVSEELVRKWDMHEGGALLSIPSSGEAILTSVVRCIRGPHRHIVSDCYKLLSVTGIRFFGARSPVVHSTQDSPMDVILQWREVRDNIAISAAGHSLGNVCSPKSDAKNIVGPVQMDPWATRGFLVLQTLVRCRTGPTRMPSVIASTKAGTPHCGNFPGRPQSSSGSLNPRHMGPANPLQYSSQHIKHPLASVCGSADLAATVGAYRIPCVYFHPASLSGSTSAYAYSSRPANATIPPPRTGDPQHLDAFLDNNNSACIALCSHEALPPCSAT